MTKVKIPQKKLPKDARITLRVNKELKAALMSKGISLQAELDKAMQKLADVYLEIGIK